MVHLVRTVVIAAILVAASGSSLLAQDARLELRKGDHISLIGNTLADRMQHEGHLETLLTAAFRSISSACET